MPRILVSIEISARHIHLSQKDLETLFGKGYELEPLKSISQYGQYAAKEVVKVETKKTFALPHCEGFTFGEECGANEVRVVGPVRKETQLEITATDAFYLGIKPPVCLSGDLEQSIGGVFLIGPKGMIELKKGVIIAKRHIHASEKDVEKYNLKHGEIVSVKTKRERAVTFHNVIVRVDTSFRWSMHIDVDEANAAGIIQGGQGELII